MDSLIIHNDGIKQLLTKYQLQIYMVNFNLNIKLSKIIHSANKYKYMYTFYLINNDIHNILYMIYNKTHCIIALLHNL